MAQGLLERLRREFPPQEQSPFLRYMGELLKAAKQAPSTPTKRDSEFISYLSELLEMAKRDEAERASSLQEDRLASVWDQASKRVVSGEVIQLSSRSVVEEWSHDFSREEIEATIAPKRTLARRLSKDELLTVEETDRALRLARLASEANRVFGEHEKAHRWLRKPNRALNNSAPLTLARTEAGARLVEDLLIQIDHGVFA